MVDTSVIVQEYAKHRSLNSLYREYGIPQYKIKKILQEQGVHIRSKQEQNRYNSQNQRKYTVNDSFFSSQNPDMAYMIGFIGADGCIRAKDNSIKIALSKIDKPFLESVKSKMDIENPIHDYITNKGYEVSELRFRSYQMKQDLKEYGIVPRKTYTFSFPEKLESQYYIDFIRGFFDGDGSISTAGPALRWQLCSYNSNILVRIVDILFDHGIPKVNIQKYKNKHLYYIQYSTVPTRNIFSILYYPGCFCLPRKYEKYKQLLMK